MSECPGFAGSDLIVRAFAEAVAKYQRVHEGADERSMNPVPESRVLEHPQDRQGANGAQPSTSQASGVEVRNEAAGPVPINPQASQAHVGPKQARSVESGVHGPYNEAADEQEPQSSKHRFYKHHAVTATKLKKQHKDQKQGLQRQLEHEAAVSARTKVNVPAATDAAQPVVNPFQYQFPLPTAAPSLQQSYPCYPVPPVPSASKGPLPPGAQYPDPKLWQMPYFPSPVPPPFFFGFGPNALPSLSLWQQMQFYNALQGPALMQQAQFSQQFTPQAQAMPQPTQMSHQPQGMPQAQNQPPAPAQPPAAGLMTQQPGHAAGVPVWSATHANPAPSLDSLNRSERVAAASLGLSCKQQIELMAEMGLPTEAQLESAARAKAAELGDPDLAQLLMTWYYAGYYTGKRESGGTAT